MNPSPAPIAYFAFNRPGHAERSLVALAANAEAARTDLHIFIDGPRCAAERELVREVERVARSVSGFRSLEIVVSARNQGLFKAITTGVGRVVREAGRVVVVEDDIVVSPHFLAYMNEALERYASEPRAGSIHGYAPPIDGLPDFYFLRGADCWGWATWADRWSLFRHDASSLLREIVAKGQLDEFCASHGIGSLLLLLRRARGMNQSWAILWHASLFLAGRLTLHPGTSLVDNIGNDGSGAHAADSELYATALITHYNGLPADLHVTEDTQAAHALRSFLDESTVGGEGSLRRLLIPIYARLAAHLQANLS